MKFLAAVAALTIFLASSAFAQNAKEHVEMLFPTVMVAAKGGTGSGTVLFSNQMNQGEDVQTYILTNYHVVRNNIKVTTEYDPRTKEEVTKETRTPLRIERWKYNDWSYSVGTETVDAEVVAYDGDRDLALIKLKDTERPLPFVAAVFPEDDKYHLWDDVWAVGAKLGRPHSPTQGILANLSAEVGHSTYLMATAPIIYGNSGGAGYRYSEKRDKYEFIGVPSGAAIIPQFFSVDIVTDMGLWIPIETVREFLAEWCYSPVVGSENGDHCEGLGKLSHD